MIIWVWAFGKRMNSLQLYWTYRDLSAFASPVLEWKAGATTFWFLETGSLYVTLAILEFTVQTRLVSSTQRSTCLSPPSAMISAPLCPAELLYLTGLHNRLCIHGLQTSHCTTQSAASQASVRRSQEGEASVDWTWDLRSANPSAAFIPGGVGVIQCRRQDNTEKWAKTLWYLCGVWRGKARAEMLMLLRLGTMLFIFFNL